MMRFRRIAKKKKRGECGRCARRARPAGGRNVCDDGRGEEMGTRWEKKPRCVVLFTTTLAPHHYIVHGFSSSCTVEELPWWWTSFHSPFCFSKTFVATIVPLVAPESTCSTQVTMAAWLPPAKA